MRFKGVEIKCFIDQKKQQLAKRQAAKTRGKGATGKNIQLPSHHRAAGSPGSRTRRHGRQLRITGR